MGSLLIIHDNCIQMCLPLGYMIHEFRLPDSNKRDQKGVLCVLVVPVLLLRTVGSQRDYAADG